MTIKATIIKDSIYGDNRITTFELEYPRFIHAEMLTHRLFSRNAASSRAIPVVKTAKQIKENPEKPIIWGKNISGMQSLGELKGIKLIMAKGLWKLTAKMAAQSSVLLSKLGLHKQWANRVAEYAQTYKVVVTATEYDNFFHLRAHKDAQPEIKKLAEEMQYLLDINKPENLNRDEWHLPYVHTCRDCLGNIIYLSEEIEPLTGDDVNFNKTKILPTITLEDAKKISVSACAQVSYRKLDTSLNKAKKIHDMLIKAEVIHASPFEHIATPMVYHRLLQPLGTKDWEDGVTHMDKDGRFWSGNFKGWVQYRHLIPNNTFNKD